MASLENYGMHVRKKNMCVFIDRKKAFMAYIGKIFL